ncbi:MAG: hypothetical protein DCC50_10570 [Acidobacteria bacterium]|nr:MAG: hypothetical protein DCC50_10570 [Acidobacteriota bacterium]
MTSVGSRVVPGAARRQHPATGAPVATARPVLVWTGALAPLVTLSSVAGLVDPRVYAQETQNWTLQAQGEDLGNLLAVVVLVASSLLHARGSARAGVVWIGTLLYLVYAFVIYGMAVHLNQLFLVYVAVLGLSAWAVLLNADGLRHAAPRWSRDRATTFPAVVLIAVGVLFAGLWLSELVPAALTGQVPASITEAGLAVNPVHVIDLAVVLPAFVLTGIAALRGRERGGFWLGPWLVFSTLMGASIVAAMALMVQAGDTAAAVPAVMVSGVVLASLLGAWLHLRATA